jgi:hypothetical protein
MITLNGTAPSPAVVTAIRRVLRPLVRLMLSSGITYPFVSEMLKGLFVEVADREFGLEGRQTTDSRISLISGVHRKDVRRLRGAEDQSGEAMPDTVSFGGRLVATWLGDARFVDDDGRPRPLARTRSDGGAPCFEDLVVSRSSDLRPRVVLDEWLRLGIVSIDAQDRLVLNAEAFVPNSGLDESLFFFGHNLQAHAEAGTDNILGARRRTFERSLIYDGLADSGIEVLEKRTQQLGTRMLKELDRVASEHDTGESAAGGERRRVTCGIYFYAEPAARVRTGPTRT